MAERILQLEDGTRWARPPMERDDEDSPTHRAIHSPDSLTRADLAHLAAMAEAYGILCTEPWMAPKLPMIRRALRQEATR